MPSTEYDFKIGGQFHGSQPDFEVELVAVEGHRQLSLLLDIQGAGGQHRQAFAEAAQGELAVRVGQGRLAMATDPCGRP